MRSYDIWSEGYVATGGSGRVYYHGYSSGESFKEACVNFARENNEFNKYFDAERMSFWGCKLYSSSSDASASYG
ncbi:hypothetical protein [Paenibacillus pini]|uniref:Uncharacterized protein n=1 Tax=Paenibacillus pini JCM 16418 TaxID=1236976 RepID=W7YIK5_9BACL|nr:hypothetical protein [Paenibacillus pini]GAF10730.1 hypothetical protein JCM16418_4949 [Paenibacillus pini JCM 16418]